jgi:catalase
VRDAFGHLKAIGCVPEAQPLLEKAAIVADTQLGLVTFESKADFDTFIETAKKYRIWYRERLVRPPR